MAKPKLVYLDTEEEERIYGCALELLVGTGVAVPNEAARQALREFGVRVEGEMAFVSEGAVGRAIESVPRQYLMAGREARFDVRPGDGGSYAATATGTEGYLDVMTGSWRKTRKADIAEWATLVDGLSNISILSSPFPEDAPLRTREVHIAYLALRHCRKPMYLQPFTVEALEYIFRLAEIVAGGADALRERPLVAVSSTCFTPLQFKEEDLNLMMRAGRAGAPTSITSIGVAGASCPVTIAGTLVVTLAEMLAGLTISQAANPGAPIFFTPKMMIMDMLTGSGKQGSTEGAIYSVALAQVVDRFVHVPLNLNGFAADSMVVDGQSQAERLANCMVAALNSPAISMSAGKLEAGSAASPLQLVMDDQYWSIMSRLQQGLDASPEAIGMDVVRSVGHHGDYVGEAHTLEYFRREQVIPSLFNRQTREVWASAGSKSFEERAREHALLILAERKGDVLSPEMLAEMGAVVRSADSAMS